MPGRPIVRLAILFITVALASATGAQEADPAPVPTAPAVDSAMDLQTLISVVKQQQAELAAQRELIESQSKAMQQLRDEIDALREPQLAVEDADAAPADDDAERVTADDSPEKLPAVAPPEPEETKTGTAVAAAPDTQADAPPEVKTEAEKTVEKAEKKIKDTTEQVASAQEDDPTREILDEFPGGWRLPGTTAALRIGGYVKTAVIYNFDPLATDDRFIVGRIPTASVSGVEAESNISPSQSRINFDLREPTDVGLLRAFVEGDFAGDGETFRLRHAFGQWHGVLVGKTWTAFQDTSASPEEVDFEGLNGRINVRQSQVRFRPRFGERFEFQFSLEDPDMQVQNGDGTARVPDIIATSRFHWQDRLHLKFGMMGRQIRARSTDADSSTEKKFGWGATLGGSFATPLFDERDQVLFQINGGRGIGRYINDLSSSGQFDGIFDGNTGKFDLFNVYAGYLSLQHWWAATLRSNATFGFVYIDNPEFVSGDAYRRTLRTSANLLWTPTPRLNLGAELLWGERETESGANGDALQIQVMTQFHF